MNYDKWEHFWYKHPVISQCIKLTILGAVVAGVVIYGIMVSGCGAEAKSEITGENNTAKTDASATDDGSAKADNVEGDQVIKVVNNSWVPFVIIALALPIMFFAYLWWSKSFAHFGRS